MTTKLVKWASNDGQIIEPGLSDGCRTKLLTSVVEIVYNCPRTGGYLGNVGLYSPRIAVRGGKFGHDA